VPALTLQADTDVIVRVDTTTIFGSDLHILKGDTPEVTTVGASWATRPWAPSKRLGPGSRRLPSGTGSLSPASVPAAPAGSVAKVGFAAHHFGLHNVMDAYDTFARASDTGSVKVVLSR
jgi:hypothetical protein